MQISERLSRAIVRTILNSSVVFIVIFLHISYIFAYEELTISGDKEANENPVLLYSSIIDSFHVVWRCSGDPCYARVSGNSLESTFPLVNDEDYQDLGISLFVNASGLIHVVWITDTSVKYAWSIINRPTDRSDFQIPATAPYTVYSTPTTPKERASPVILQDTSKRIHIFWYEPNNQIFYSNSSDGINWPINPATVSYTAEDLGIDGLIYNDEIFLFWVNSSLFPGIVVANSTDWINWTAINITGDHGDRYPSAVNIGDTIYITWERNGEIMLGTISVADESRALTNIQTIAQGRYPKIDAKAISGSDIVIIVFYNSTGEYHFFYNITSSEKHLEYIGSKYYSPDIAIDSAGISTIVSTKEISGVNRSIMIPINSDSFLYFCKLYSTGLWNTTHYCCDGDGNSGDIFCSGDWYCKYGINITSSEDSPGACGCLNQGDISNPLWDSSGEVGNRCCDPGEEWCSSDGVWYCYDGKNITEGDFSPQACSCVSSGYYDIEVRCCDSGDHFCSSDRSWYCDDGSKITYSNYSKEACLCLATPVADRWDDSHGCCDSEISNIDWCSSDRKWYCEYPDGRVVSDPDVSKDLCICMGRAYDPIYYCCDPGDSWESGLGWICDNGVPRWDSDNSREYCAQNSTGLWFEKGDIRRCCDIDDNFDKLGWCADYDEISQRWYCLGGKKITNPDANPDACVCLSGNDARYYGGRCCDEENETFCAGKPGEAGWICLDGTVVTDPDTSKSACECLSSGIWNENYTGYTDRCCDKGDIFCGSGFFCNNSIEITDPDFSEAVCNCLSTGIWDEELKCCDTEDIWCKEVNITVTPTPVPSAIPEGINETEISQNTTQINGTEIEQTINETEQNETSEQINITATPPSPEITVTEEPEITPEVLETVTPAPTLDEREIDVTPTVSEIKLNLKEDGEFCTGAEQCKSNNCINSICCEENKICCRNDGDCENGTKCDKDKFYCITGNSDRLNKIKILIFNETHFSSINAKLNASGYEIKKFTIRETNMTDVFSVYVIYIKSNAIAWNITLETLYNYRTGNLTNFTVIGFDRDGNILFESNSTVEEKFLESYTGKWTILLYIISFIIVSAILTIISLVILYKKNKQVIDNRIHELLEKKGLFDRYSNLRPVLVRLGIRKGTYEQKSETSGFEDESIKDEREISLDEDIDLADKQQQTTLPQMPPQEDMRQKLISQLSSEQVTQMAQDRFSQQNQIAVKKQTPQQNVLRTSTPAKTQPSRIVRNYMISFWNQMQNPRQYLYATKYCKYCRAPMPFNELFCPKCGRNQF